MCRGKRGGKRPAHCRRGHSSLVRTSLPPSKRSGSGKKGTLGSELKSGGNVPVFCSQASPGRVLGKSWSICCRSSFRAVLVWASRHGGAKTNSATRDAKNRFFIICPGFRHWRHCG